MFFVDLPASVELSITAAVTAAFYLLARFIVAQLPWLGGFFERYAAEWALGLSVAFIGVLENFLPEAYPEISVLAVQLVLAILVAVGVGVKFLAGRNAKGFKS